MFPCQCVVHIDGHITVALARAERVDISAPEILCSIKQRVSMEVMCAWHDRVHALEMIQIHIQSTTDLHCPGAGDK